MSDSEDWSSDDDCEALPTSFPSLSNPPTSSPTLAASLSLDASRGLDLLPLVAELARETKVAPTFHTLIRLVNCLRSGVPSNSLLAPRAITADEVADCPDAPAYPAGFPPGHCYTFLHPCYYRPERADDAYLQSIDELLELLGAAEPDEEAQPVSGESGEVKELREKLAAAAKLVEALSSSDPPPPPTSSGVVVAEPAQDNDSYYFDSYGHYGIHETMLKDAVRTGSYCDSIKKNRGYFEGKAWLDVGCGTGVLSFFASRYGGARVVYGVDDSNMINMARKIMDVNGVTKEEVVLMRGKMEDLELPEKVDVIVSEWMGYGLL
jgi:hypothetical protein